MACVYFTIPRQLHVFYILHMTFLFVEGDEGNNRVENALLVSICPVFVCMYKLACVRAPLGCSQHKRFLGMSSRN